MSAAATSREERPLFFRSADEDLFGIITEPTAAPNGVGLVLLTGGGVATAAPGRNRLFVRIARHAARHGYYSLRFDYHGVGESTGEVERYRLDEPFVGDVLAGVRCLQEHGVSEVALAGTCFGARTALAAAESITRLRGVALLAPPIGDFEMGTPAIEATPMAHFVRRSLSSRVLRGLRDPRRRRKYAQVVRTKLRAATRGGGSRLGRSGLASAASPRFSEPLARLGERGTPVLLAYGTEDDVYAPFRDARPELSAIFDMPGARFDERLIPGEIHRLSRLTVQEAVVTLLDDWLASLNGGLRGP